MNDSYLEDIFLLNSKIAAQILGYIPLVSWAQLSAVSTTFRNEIRNQALTLKNVHEFQLFPLWTPGSGPAKIPSNLRKYGNNDHGASDWLLKWAPQINQWEFSSAWFYDPIFIPRFLSKFSNLTSLSLCMAPGNEVEIFHCLQENSTSLKEIAIEVEGIDIEGIPEQTIEPFPVLERFKFGRKIPGNAQKRVGFPSSERFYRILSALLNAIPNPELLTSFEFTCDFKRPDIDILQKLKVFLSKCQHLLSLSVFPLNFCSEAVLFVDAPNLASFHTDSTDFESLEMLCPKFPILKELTITRRMSSSLSKESVFLSNLSQYCPKLEKLRILGQGILVQNMFLLPQISLNSHLTQLNLEGISTLEHIWQLEKLPSLQNLSLHFVPRKREKIQLELNLPKLRYLQLEETRNGLFDLKLGYPNSLETIRINPRKVQGAPQFFASLPNLSHIVLRDYQELEKFAELSHRISKLSTVTLIEPFATVTDIFGLLRRIARTAKVLKSVRLNVGEWKTLMQARTEEMLQFEYEIKSGWRNESNATLELFQDYE